MHSTELDPNMGGNVHHDVDENFEDPQFIAPTDNFAIEKMKEIIASEFQVEIEHKEQKMMEVERALAQLNNVWKELQEVWAKKQFDPSVGTMNETEEAVQESGKKRKKKKSPVIPESQVFYARRLNGQYVILVCPTCGKKNFSTLLGFSNHCRIIHKIKFLTYDQVTEYCGFPVDESEVPENDPCRQKRLLASFVHDVKESYTQDDSQKRRKVEINSANISRFYVRKQVIVGNTCQVVSQWNGMGANDQQTTHKWMVYVKTDETKEVPVQEFVRKVRFFLHPSFAPDDIVEVLEAPFQITRTGWGEFPVRVQLHFVDAKNKPINIVHHLTLNSEASLGNLQTLGGETITDIDLDREFFTAQNNPLNATNNNALSASQHDADGLYGMKKDQFGASDFNFLKNMDPQYDSYLHFVNPFARPGLMDAGLSSHQNAMGALANPAALSAGVGAENAMTHDGSSVEMNMSAHEHVPHYAHQFGYDEGNATNSAEPGLGSDPIASANNNSSLAASNNNNISNNPNSSNNNNSSALPLNLPFGHSHMLPHHHFDPTGLGVPHVPGHHLGDALELQAPFGAMRRNRDASELHLTLEQESYLIYLATQEFPLFAPKIPVKEAPSYSQPANKEQWRHWTHAKRMASELQRFDCIRIREAELTFRAKKIAGALVEKYGHTVFITGQQMKRWLLNKGLTPARQPVNFNFFYDYELNRRKRAKLRGTSLRLILQKIKYCMYCGLVHLPVDKFEQLERDCGERARLENGPAATVTPIQVHLGALLTIDNAMNFNVTAQAVRPRKQPIVPPTTTRALMAPLPSVQAQKLDETVESMDVIVIDDDEKKKSAATPFKPAEKKPPKSTPGRKTAAKNATARGAEPVKHVLDDDEIQIIAPVKSFAPSTAPLAFPPFPMSAASSTTNNNNSNNSNNSANIAISRNPLATSLTASPSVPPTQLSFLSKHFGATSQSAQSPHSNSTMGPDPLATPTKLSAPFSPAPPMSQPQLAPPPKLQLNSAPTALQHRLQLPTQSPHSSISNINSLSTRDELPPLSSDPTSNAASSQQQQTMTQIPPLPLPTTIYDPLNMVHPYYPTQPYASPMQSINSSNMALNSPYYSNFSSPAPNRTAGSLMVASPMMSPYMQHVSPMAPNMASPLPMNYPGYYGYGVLASPYSHFASIESQLGGFQSYGPPAAGRTDIGALWVNEVMGEISASSVKDEPTIVQPTAHEQQQSSQRLEGVTCKSKGAESKLLYNAVLMFARDLTAAICDVIRPNEENERPEQDDENMTPSSPRVVTPYHVLLALKSKEHFDFLRNDGLSKSEAVNSGLSHAVELNRAGEGGEIEMHDASGENNNDHL